MRFTAWSFRSGAQFTSCLAEVVQPAAQKHHRVGRILAAHPQRLSEHSQPLDRTDDMLHAHSHPCQLPIRSFVSPVQGPAAGFLVRRPYDRRSCFIALQTTVGQQSIPGLQPHSGQVCLRLIMSTARHRRRQQHDSPSSRRQHILHRRALAPPTVVRIPSALMLRTCPRACSTEIMTFVLLAGLF